MESGKIQLLEGMEARRSRTHTQRKEIKNDDFDKLEIRVAEVKKFLKVDSSDKLLQFAGQLEQRKSSNPLWDC